MSSSFVCWNCTRSLIERIRDVLSDDVPLVECGTWDEVCEVMQNSSQVSLIAQACRESPANGHAVESLAEPTAADAATAERTLARQIDEWERRIIEQTLRKNRNHRKETAADLGISRVTLYNKMKKFGML